jgi:hypothetical protein
MADATAGMHYVFYTFSAALWLLIMTERVVNAIASLLVKMVWGKQASSSAVQCLLLGSAVESIARDYSVDSVSLHPRTKTLMNIHQTMHLTDPGMMYNIQQYASMQMVGAGFTFFSSVLYAIGTCFWNAILALSTYAIWAGITMLFFSILFMLQEYYLYILLDAVEQYNSTYTPILHKVVFIPLQVSMS